MTVFTSCHDTWRVTNTQEKIDAIFTPAIRTRFWSKVKRGGVNECWPWVGSLTFFGYGSFGVGGRNFRANRVSYMLTTGPIGPDLHVLHSCDNPACVNPAHLREGTIQENSRERTAKGRVPVCEKNGGAKLRAEDVYVIRDSAESSTALGQRYGVHPTTISSIKRRYLWADLPERASDRSA